MAQSRHNLVICMAGIKGKYDLVGNGKSSFWPCCSLCICSLPGFNVFCQILNFTTKCPIMPWHSASGKCTGPESAAAISREWKHTLKNKLHSLPPQIGDTHCEKKKKRRSNSSTQQTLIRKHDVINTFLLGVHVTKYLQMLPICSFC